MSGSSSHDSPSRKAQPQEDAHDGASSSAAALGRTLEAELTRAATRANPASPTPSAASPATPETPATSAAHATPAAPSGVPTPAPPAPLAEPDLDLISASSAAAADAEGATADGDTLTAEDPDAEAADADNAQSNASASRRPRIGWGGVLALLNVVLSGFILMLWGVPRWDGGRGATQSARAGEGAGTGANRVDASRNGRGPSSAAVAASAGDPAATSIDAASAAGATVGLNAAAGTGALARRASQATRGDSSGDAGAGEIAGANGGAGASARAEIPDLPQAIISVMPGQRAPDVTIPAAPPPPPPAAARAGNPAPPGLGAGTGTGAVTTGADAAIEAGNAAARTAPSAREAGDNPAARIPIAGADGVTMPERLAESHVRPTIAALAEGGPVTGEVTLAATVRIDGSVADVQVLSSSRPGAGLEHAATDAVRRWRYKPATRDGQPIDSRLTITVTFR